MRLFAFEKAWAEATFGAFFPEGSALPRGVSGMRPGDYLDDTIAAVELEPALGIRLSLWICAFAPVFFLRKLVTIHGASPEDRERAIDLAAKSSIYPVRQLVIALKAMGAMLYAGAADVREPMLRVTAEEHEQLVRLRRGALHGASGGATTGARPAVPADPPSGDNVAGSGPKEACDAAQ
jgi:hypothetical protein